VDGEGEARRRGEQVELAPQQHGVGAQVDEALAGDQLGDHLADVGVEQRLTTGDRHDRSAALLDGPDRLLDGEALTQDLRRVLDLAAPGAGEVAGEQRLELDDERVLLAPADSVPEHVGADSERLASRYGH
jgi:hypothetical protein